MTPRPGYRTELAEWSGRGQLASDGVPAANVPARPLNGEVPLRQFFSGSAEDRPAVSDQDCGEELLVLATSSDDLSSQLVAGESLSAVLLSATASGLATCPLSQPLEVDSGRARIRDEILGGTRFPQLVPEWGGCQCPRLRCPRRLVGESATS